MRGIVLAGGTGSRLGFLTKVVNKHLLPVGHYPMICWPLAVLKANGINDITIVSTPRGIGQLSELLGGSYTYRVQDTPGGIPQAMAVADDKSGSPVVVILGDNIFTEPPIIPVPLNVSSEWACCFLKTVPHSRMVDFGMPEFDAGGLIRYIIEKPKEPTNNYAVTGLYVFGSDVFTKITKLTKSARGETEVADLLNDYAKKGNLSHRIVEHLWGDAGTYAGLKECNSIVTGIGGLVL